MTGALVILAALVVIGLLLYITDVKYFRHHHSSDSSLEAPQPDDKSGTNSDNTTSTSTTPEVCCGLHLVCEKESPGVYSDEIIYYDDEELDRFAGRIPESYSSDEIEEFRNILMTMLPQDTPGWARSITRRNIELPSEIRDELLLIISDLRS